MPRQAARGKRAIKGDFSGWLKRCFRYLFNFGKGFIDDRCSEKASALSFYSLLSIVPFLAILFGIGQAMGIGSALETSISARFSQQPEVGQKLIEFAHSSLANVEGGLIAGVGVIALLWSAFSLLNGAEIALNEIWKTTKERSYFRKTRDYLVVLLIAPLFLVGASSINVYLGTEFKELAEGNAFAGAASSFLLALLELFPYVLMWFLFLFIYLFLPNVRVRVRDAVVAAMIAGTAFQFWQWVYIQFQMSVSSYGAIYGSFAALPLFLIWLQVSWLIVLAGAELMVTEFPES
jgi:membrane protein